MMQIMKYILLTQFVPSRSPYFSPLCSKLNHSCAQVVELLPHSPPEAEAEKKCLSASTLYKTKRILAEIIVKY